MEENKTKQMHPVEQEATSPGVAPQIGYDELKEKAQILMQRNHELETKLMEVMQDNALMKLNFLMEAIKIDGKFSDSFIATAVAEIEQTIYPEPEKVESKK